MSALPRDMLLYTEGQYRIYLGMRDRPMAERRAYFGSGAAEQMERRYQSEVCVECEERCDEDDLPPYGEPVICYRCQCKRRFVQGGRDDPDGHNDVPLSEQS